MPNRTAHRLGRYLALVIALACCYGASAQGADTETETATEPASETAALLQRLLTFKTVNPPGQTRELDAFLQRQFEPLGAEVEIIETPLEGVSHFVARLRGDGSADPVLLAAHADVVPVEREQWSVDPFAGVIQDGYVLGRGAMDFKGGLAVFARAVMMLAENEVPLKRDVILLVEANEEAGDYGTDWLAEHHWDKIDAEFALNEGGWILTGEDGGVTQVNITTADKVYLTLELTASGTPTHSSRPTLEPSAINRLSVALAKLSETDTQPFLNAQTRAYFASLARTSADPLAGHLRTLSESRDARALQQAGEAVVTQGAYPELWHALMRNTLAITMLDAGVKENVIPGHATATVNIRMVPGTSLDDVLGEVRRIIGDPEVKVSIPYYASLPEAHAAYRESLAVTPSSETTALYRAPEKHAKASWPEAQVASALFEAGTDAAAWRERGVPVYGVYPYPLDNATLLRMHGNDERIAISSLDAGTEWIYETLLEVAGK